MSHPVPDNAEHLNKTTGHPDHADVFEFDGDEALTPASTPTTPPTPVRVGGTLDMPDETAPHLVQEGARDGSGTAGQSKAEAAKEQGQQVKDEAMQGGKHVAEVASEQAQSVLSEATDQAQDLMRQARSQLGEQAITQQENLTAWLRSLADELREMVGGPADRDHTSRQTSLSADQPNHGPASNGVAAKALAQAHGRVEDAADWLEQHEPSDLVEEATRFARRRPGAFLAVAAIGGLLVGRFARGVKDDSSTDSTPARASAREGSVASSPPLDIALTQSGPVRSEDLAVEAVRGTSPAARPPVSPGTAGLGVDDLLEQDPR